VPQGELSAIWFMRTTSGPPFYFGRDVYAEVTVYNPPTGITTLYSVKAYYATENGYRQVSQNTVDPSNGRERLLVELAPGQSKTVRLYLKKYNEFDDGQPRQGDLVRFNLFAYTDPDQGVYLVDSESGQEYLPVPILAAAPPISIHYLSALAEPTVGTVNGPLKPAVADGISGTADFPLLTYVSSLPDSISYNLAIYANNPWPGPIATVISQPIPSQVTVLDAGDGVVRNGAIVWHRVIQPRETVALQTDFTYGNYAITVTLPAVTMRFYDSADDTVITLTGDPVLFQAKSPLRASADIQTWVGPGSVQAVAVTVHNLDSNTSQQGDLALHLSTITGTEVLSTTAHVSVGPSGSQVYNLSYTAPDVEDGLYVLDVDLVYRGLKTAVVYDLLRVAWRRIYLPVVVRNH